MRNPALADHRTGRPARGLQPHRLWARAYLGRTPADRARLRDARLAMIMEAQLRYLEAGVTPKPAWEAERLALARLTIA